MNAPSLHPIIRDVAGEPHPLAAALAAMTGQPLSAVERVLRDADSTLKRLTRRTGPTSIEDAAHLALLRFGHAPSRLYCDANRRSRLGDVLAAYAGTPGNAPEKLLVVQEDGVVHAICGQRLSGAQCSAPRALAMEIVDRRLDIEARVVFALSFVARVDVPLAQPDHGFLEATAIAAYALAEAYDIDLLPADWPYWSIAFPQDLTDGAPGSARRLVCGEYELLTTVSQHVRQHVAAVESAASVLKAYSLAQR
ncbi:hypothetical protein [Variovorax sp. ZT4R33]|uniref:hypothetical protein n=1 Tax=Variovorax sp. ZT4R33 TaxID=3443743 RepID=UPI003F450644